MPSRDGVRFPERRARLGAGGAGGDERLGLAPAAVGGERRALEPLPGRCGLRPQLGRASPRARSYSASASASQPAAFGVTAEASAAARASGGEQLPCAAEPVADGVGVPAGACERRQLRLRAQSLGAELDADLGGLAAGAPAPGRRDGLRRRPSSGAPTGRARRRAVVERQPAVLAQRWHARRRGAPARRRSRRGRSRDRRAS